MEIKIYPTYEALSAAAAEYYRALLTKKPHAVLGLATGSTPLGLYKHLIQQYQAGQLDFSDVTTFNLDEYYPMDPAHPQSYRYYMNHNLFDHVNINKKNTFVPDGTASSDAFTPADYDVAIENAGGIDLQLLGVGRNGHIGFNEPNSHLIAHTHLTDLTDSTIQANARFFNSKNDVPKQAITMGMATIMKARQILCLVSGADKHAVVQALQSHTVTPQCPATFLQLHPNAIILCDQEAING